MFSKFNNELQAKFKQFKEENEIFYVDINRDTIYEKYLDGFETESLRQEHTCNCCKQFLRQFGGIVIIKNNRMISIWDNLNVPSDYTGSIKNLSEYIHTLPVSSVFRSVSRKLGTEESYDSDRDIYWKHFFLEVDSKYIVPSIKYGTILGNTKTEQGTLLQAIDELTIDATETVLELVAQNILYRGTEFKGMLEAFLKVQYKFKDLTSEQKELVAWVESRKSGGAVNKIRTSAIGTLLQDISNGEELDNAVRSFESKVSGNTYKRTNLIATKKMHELAEKKFIELGLMDSLERRHATESDIHLDNLLFKYHPDKFKNIFTKMKEESSEIDIKKLSKVQEITYQDFIEKVLPKANLVEILFDNSLSNNFVTLTTASNMESKSLMKWNNNFAWEYTNGVTDSIKERVKKAGGNVSGILRASLSWSNYDDLDIHAYEPNGDHIYFGSKSSKSGGILDVDMNAGSGKSRSPVENIVWNGRNVQNGRYKIVVHNYARRESDNIGFELEIEFNGKIYNFKSKSSPNTSCFSRELIFDIDLRRGEISFINQPFETNSGDITKWNLKSNRFHKVKQISYSPNYWGESNIGNKHLFFFVENCVTDELTRPFYNEFLSNELSGERKSLDVLATKLKIEPTVNQLSGFGFSDTLRRDVIVRVTGKTQKNLKIKF